MSRSAGWTSAVLSSSRGVNNLAIAPCVTDAGHASRASRVKPAIGLERTPNQYGIQTPNPGFWEPPCRDAACAPHILILSFGLYGDLPSHNNAYVHTGIPELTMWPDLQSDTRPSDTGPAPRRNTEGGINPRTVVSSAPSPALCRDINRTNRSFDRMRGRSKCNVLLDHHFFS
jgi:hypothetical protein